VTLAPDDAHVATPDGRSGDPLADALRDPEVRASLAVIASHAPELAVLVSAGNGLLGRSRDIMDNINGRVQMVREASGGSDATSRYVDLASAFGEATPTIQTFLQSPILQPEIVEVIGKVGQAALEADRVTRGKKHTVGGVFALIRELKDPRVQETLAFFIAFAQAFGREHARTDSGAPGKA